jgi:diaminopimelate epimerase
MAIDGLHTATIEKDQTVSLRMHNVSDFRCEKDYTFLDTGSPHHVEMVADLPQFNVLEKGRAIRQGAPYFEAGSNVNFVEKVNENTFAIRTYERGVEDETLSCGTGATAVALAMHKTGITSAQSIHIIVEGGQLTVSFEAGESAYTNIDLQGPATFVFEGEIA